MKTETIHFPRSVPQTLLIKTLVNYINSCYEDAGWQTSGKKNRVVAKNKKLTIIVSCE